MRGGSLDADICAEMGREPKSGVRGVVTPTGRLLRGGTGANSLCSARAVAGRALPAAARLRRIAATAYRARTAVYE